jgi:catechol 2,3-dioxygenase-like lactoylglutathione lyase family enzyme
MTGLSHITLGASDKAKSAVFYDAVLGTLGYVRREKPKDFPLMYQAEGDPVTIFVGEPFDGNPVTFGNGTHVAFLAETRAQVHAFHALALQNGGTDEGAPGLRPHYAANYYAAYVRDPDGNKLQAVCYATS